MRWEAHSLTDSPWPTRSLYRPAAPRSRPAGSHDPEADLVAAARADPAEFLALYDRHVRQVQGYVRMRVADRSAVEDIVSSVFTSALAALPAFRGEGTFAAWLMAITRRAVADHYRARRSEAVAGTVLADAPDPAPGPEPKALAAERGERLRHALSTLQPSRQHLLALRFGAGLTNAQMAHVLGMRPGAVRVAVHRAMNDLRGRFGHER